MLTIYFQPIAGEEESDSIDDGSEEDGDDLFSGETSLHLHHRRPHFKGRKLIGPHGAHKPSGFLESQGSRESDDVEFEDWIEILNKFKGLKKNEKN